MTNDEAPPAIDAMSAAAFTIPTDSPEGDGTLAWDSTTLIVATVSSDGVTGTGWTYGPPACAAVIESQLAGVVRGRSALGIPGTWEAMVRAVRNDTRAGVAGYAISAVDVACWDLKARLLGVALVDLFGSAREEVPVYGSGGFTTYSEDQLTSQLTGWVHDQHIPRVKIKIGQSWGSRPDRDLARIHQAREVIGAEVELFVDANGAYSAKQAIRLMQGAADANVTWFEEPVSSDDLPGLAAVRTAVWPDVAAGEYGTDAGYFRRMCAAGAVDCLQIDATRCGGYTGWLRAASVASSYHLMVSAHCAPHLHAPVAAATPNLRHVEWFHDHVRVENLAFTGTLDPDGGAVTPGRSVIGHGMTAQWDALEEFRVG